MDSFYASVEENGCVTLEDFTEFMDFLAVIRDTDSEAVRTSLYNCNEKLIREL